MMGSWIENLKQRIPQYMRNTALVRIFGLFQIPLLWFLRPTVVEMDDEKCVVKIPLNRRSKNHLGSMYFAALCAGADCAGGLFAVKLIRQSGENVSFSFKDFNAEFHKRAEGDTYFTCTEGKQIAHFVEQVLESNERQNHPIHITATCPDKLGNEPVANFTLTLSLKKKS